jgi:metal-dependent amidase/aminoacylase/carboxypeptidase family protein
VGRFNVRAGPMMAGGAFFDIDVTGVGAHGARPETGVDSLMVAAQIASTLQSIVSRNVRAGGHRGAVGHAASTPATPTT